MQVERLTSKFRVMKNYYFWKRKARACEIEEIIILSNPVRVTSHFQYPMKISKNFWFSDVFRVY